jgi:ABC-type bacteriocin/lantibiotic exporter with double-glycine peptidase domain
MATADSLYRDRAPAQNALRALEVFSASAQLTFDRVLAGRVLSESQNAVSGNDAQAWSRRLVQVGESLNLRIRSVEGTVQDALLFVRQGIPVAYCGDAPTGEVQWCILVEASGRKVRVASRDSAEPDVWVSQRKLRKTLGLDARTSRARWVIGQAALGCQPPLRSPDHQSGDQRLSPLARLFGLVRPEKKDLWVVVIFSLVVGVLALASPIAVEALVNTVAFGRYLQPIIVLALLLFTSLAFAAAMRGLITFIVEIFQRRLFIRVVEDLAYRLPRVRQEDLDGAHGPELVNRFFDVVTIQKAASALLLDGLAIVLQTIIGMAVLAFYHPFLLGFDVVLLALISFIVFVLGRGAVETAIQESRAKYAMAAWLEELTRHPTAFKLHAGNQLALERADQLAVRWLEMRRGHFRVVIGQILFALGLQAAAATALLGLGGWLVLQGELTLGQLVAAELIVMIIVGSFAKLGKHMESFYDLLASVEKLGRLFDLRIEAHDRLFHLREGEPAGISLRGVSYSFPQAAVLKDLQLELAPGESVALIGEAGSGKSTVIDLLCGLRTPKSGHIELDGIDIRELRPDSLREHLAIARSIEIFAGTIDENVHLNRPHVQSADVRSALEVVGLSEEILRLPEGLHTPLQTGGAPLSTSQATRLMLARAIVGRPRLLLIDGTLDGLPEELLDTILARLTGERTSWTLLVATGRRAVIGACDRVVNLDRQGTGRDRSATTTYA